MATFTKTRCVELSTIDYLQAQIVANWTGVTVVKAFLQAYATKAPVVCIRLTDTQVLRQEIGSDAIRQQYGITIDIFATSDGQRLDLADRITDYLKSGWTYYSYSHPSGNNATLQSIEDGRIRLIRFDTNRRVDFGDNTDAMDKYRHTITITVEK